MGHALTAFPDYPDPRWLRPSGMTRASARGSPLEKIRVPLLVIGHAADTCVRMPASRMATVAARTAIFRLAG
jgi:hypothetical protein